MAIAAPSIRLRPARIEDASTVFAWRNDPWIIAQGSSGRAVAWEEHEAWFKRTMENVDKLLCVIESHDGVQMGTFRAERSGDYAEISVYLLKEFIGHGLGTQVITEGCRMAFARWPEIRALRAEILKKNARSIHAFTKVGFITVPGNPGAPHILMELPGNAFEAGE